MSTTRRRGPRRRAEAPHQELTHWQEDVLNCGLIILNPDAQTMLQHSFRELCLWGSSPEGRAAWNRHARHLIAGCAAKAPGTRPWGWWRWEYTGRRPWDQRPRRPKGWQADYHQYDPRDRSESFAILKRLGVLLPDEAERFLATRPEGRVPAESGETEPITGPEPMTEIVQ